MLSSKMSQPVKTRSSSPASGTNSLIFGERPSVRLPRRTVPICVSEPIGFARPLRIASTPATNVVATAPMPGIITPSFPFAGWIVPLWLADCLSRSLRISFTSTRMASSLLPSTLRTCSVSPYFGRFLSKNLYGCANLVCSRIRQEFGKRAAAKRAENQFNGAGCIIERRCQKHRLHRFRCTA